MVKRLLFGLIVFLGLISHGFAAQHDYVIDNNPGVNVRADINSVLQAIITNNSGATEPATLYPNMWWYDTSTGLLKRRNNANDAWIIIGLEAADTDGTLAANSDSKIATQKATKTYADTKASKGANSDITSLGGLTTPLSTAQGGTGSTANANTANGVVVLDVSSKLPAVDGSQLTNVGIPSSKVYDSGWFAVTRNGTLYTKTHNLGTTKILAMVYGATNSSGADMGVIRVYTYSDGGGVGQLQQITTTQISVQFNGYDFIEKNNANTAFTYARIIILALE